MKPLDWQQDRRRAGAVRAEGEHGASLTAEADGFRVELGSLSIDGDAQSLAQAVAFAEVAAEALEELDKRLSDVDRVRLGAGARVPVREQRENRKPVMLECDRTCTRCDGKGMRQELDGCVTTRMLCDCVRAR